MSEESKTERAANLFDLRRIIGGLFVAWGVLLVILGLAGMGDVENAANINLFAGLGDARVRDRDAAVGVHPAARRGTDRVRAGERERRGATARAPSGRGTPGGSSARTEPPKPPPTIRAPAAPADFSRDLVGLDLGHGRLIVVA